MNVKRAFTQAVLAVGLAAPLAHADDSIDRVVGDGPGPFAATVCQKLDAAPSVQMVRWMMNNYGGMFMTRQEAWGVILNGVVWDCQQHADLLRQYASFYGNF